MNNLKKLFALILCLAVMVTCFTGCHKKGEISVKIGDIEFTSGYYACALVFADTEARATVETDLSEKGDLPDKINYWDYKVEDTDYVEWVETAALNNLKDLAALMTLCAEAGVELDAETKSLALSNADYLWDTYGYSALMEANGVSKETFRQYMQDGYLADAYFEHLYAKGGEKEIAADKISEQLVNNYVLVNQIVVSFEGMSDEKKESSKNQLATYEASLKEGKASFEDVYLSYNNLSAEDHKHEEAKEGEVLPQDQHATILGNEDTGYASDYFTAAKALAVGEVKVITLEENAGLVLLVRKDISADPYYLSELDLTLRRDIVGDGYTDEVSKYGSELSCEVITSSTKQFKVKKLVYPESLYY